MSDCDYAPGRDGLELFQRVVETNHNGMFICSAAGPDRFIRYVNPALEALFEQRQDELIGRPIFDLFPLEPADEIARLKHDLQAEQPAQLIFTIHSDSGKLSWLELDIMPVPDEAGVIQEWFGVLTDISQRQTVNANMAFHAEYDELTGCLRRHALIERLDHAISDVGRADDETAVLFIDMDGLKQINDRLGHDVGDQCLKTLARRLQGRIRENDILARIGGDEFVLVSPGLQWDRAMQELGVRLREAVSQPMVLANETFKISCSIGVASYPAHGVNPETLLRHADLAMYVAKRNGGNRIESFSTEMGHLSLANATLMVALREALAKDEFAVAYQPQIEMRGPTIVGLEALLRWPDAPADCQNPVDFIPVAEETGLIHAIGTWILRQACQDLARLRHAGYKELTMAVNASVVQLRKSAFAEEVAAAIIAANVPPEALEIEITESVIFAEDDQATRTLYALDALGVRLSIDDFGKGHSNLMPLRELPIRRLKIDRSFVSNQPGSQCSREKICTIRKMADNLNLESLVEGVETEAQMSFLLDNGLIFGQGFYYSEALPIADLMSQFTDPASRALPPVTR